MRSRVRNWGAFVVAAALIVFGTVAAKATAYHATLLRSTPAANSTLLKRPDTVRLVFSEGVVPDLSQVAIVAPDSSTVQLGVTNDPHDVHVLLGVIPTGALNIECSGTPCVARYRLTWHVLSADGHPVGGAFFFSVANQHRSAATQSVDNAAASSTAVVSTTRSPDTARPESVSSDDGIPWLAAVARGLGLGAIMAAVGLLFFGRDRTTTGDASFRSRISTFVAIGTLLLIVHMYAWLRHIAPNRNLSGSVFTTAVGSGVGRWELARVVLAILTLWAIALARSERIALSLGILCLLASGAVGHPAAIAPAWTVPAKMAHLVAGAIWLGGLLWLLQTYRANSDALARESRRVSTAALYSLILVLLSGVIQIRFFLNTPSDLFASYYGRLALAKIAGLVILIGYGGYNRYRAMPAMANDKTGDSLKRAISQELVVMTMLVLVGGLLAYVPTPAVVPAAQTSGQTQ